MRFPTLKSLREIHDADHSRMRKIGKMTRADLVKLPEVAGHIRASYGRPSVGACRLLALNTAARTHGVESLRLAGRLGMDAEDYAEYLNTGDMYAATLIRWQGFYRVQSVGDFIETQERRGIRFE